VRRRSLRATRFLPLRPGRVADKDQQSASSYAEGGIEPRRDHALPWVCCLTWFV
jgi:hypothetical protein